MKRLLFIILALLLFSGCEARTRKEETLTAPNRQIGNSSESSAPLLEGKGEDLSDFLPDFLVLREKSYGADYQNVASWQMQAYLDALKADGFACEANDYQSLYFKDNVLIEIHDNVASDQQCSVKVSLARPTPGESAPTCEEFQRELNEPGIFYVLEQTPPGFYEETKTRIFLAAAKYTWQAGSAPKYNVFYALVSPSGMLPLNAYDNIAPPVCYDLDGDGSTEILTLGYGPTSGIFTFTLRAYAIVNGTPVMDAEKTFTANHGDITIDVKKDGVSLYYTPYEIVRWYYLAKTKEIPVHLKNHKFTLETARESDPEPWLAFSADYALLTAQLTSHLDVYVWTEDDTYWCGLTAHNDPSVTAAVCNDLCPVTLEEMGKTLAVYQGPAENITVYFVERPVLTDDYKMQTEGDLIQELRRQLLGST